MAKEKLVFLKMILLRSVSFILLYVSSLVFEGESEDLRRRSVARGKNIPDVNRSKFGLVNHKDNFF